MRWLLFLFLLVIAAPARGAEVNRIVVVAPEVDAEVGSRIRAELVALGFEVVDGELETTLEDLARSQEAAFALAVAVHADGYEVTLRDRVTQKTLMREVVGASEPSESALRVVELLRASLLELRARHPVEGEVPANPKLAKIAEQTLKPAPRRTVTKVVRTSEPELTAMERFARDFTSTDRTALGSVELAGSWLFDGGGSASGLGIEAAGGIFMPRYLQTRFTARYQFLPSTLELPEGRIQFRAAQLGVSLALHVIDPADVISPFVELGGLFTWLHVEGTTPYRALKGHDADAFALVPFLAPGFIIGGRSSPLRGRAALGIGLPIPALDITVGDAVAESWGRPLVYASWGFQYQFR